MFSLDLTTVCPSPFFKLFFPEFFSCFDLFNQFVEIMQRNGEKKLEFV